MTIDKEAVRADLEHTRSAYHELLASISEDGWRRKSGNADMTVAQLMWHTAWATDYMARVIDKLRAGRGDLSIPRLLENPMRKLAMRWQARDATPERAARAYDAGHAALLARLDALRDDEWSLGARRFGELRTVGWYLQHPTEHFEEHAADVRAVLTERSA